MSRIKVLLDRSWQEQIAIKNRRRLAMARTTHRSKSVKKLYAVRDKQGRFKDIQSYKRAHGQDIKRRSKKEK
jgi:hypothetical protein